MLAAGFSEVRVPPANLECRAGELAPMDGLLVLGTLWKSNRLQTHASRQQCSILPGDVRKYVKVMEGQEVVALRVDGMPWLFGSLNVIDFSVLDVSQSVDAFGLAQKAIDPKKSR
jgi:hypothetical protein